MSIKTVPKDTFELTPKGIVIHGTPTKDHAMEFAEQFIYLVGMAPIALADLYLYLRDNFSEADAVSLVPAIGRTKHTLQNWVSIVSKFPISRRVDGLEMGHYDALSGLKTKDDVPDVGKQNELAKRAGAEGWTIGRLREEVKAINDARTRKTIDVPDSADKPDEDKPVFDNTSAGIDIAAERGENRAAYSEQAISDVNQVMLDALAKAEKAFSHENVSFANLGRLSAQRLRALGERIIEVSAAVDAAQENAFRRQRPSVSA